ncbi:unnamed protein product [Cylicocyclus nassatus]|uniref:Uncharacterized protein n=1 Tax=Cylicocyclus nassatus TaxID=53992 RepID=A0AA36GUR4_CYLNA|nr:unnamed protein product [Cylicocyclus nassatus]
MSQIQHSPQSASARSQRQSRRRRSRSRRRHRSRNRVRLRDLTHNDLVKLARAAREREGYEEFCDTIRCHGLSINGLIRAKNRQSKYLMYKGSLLYMQTACVMLVCFMAAIVSRYIKEDDQSWFYCTQTTIEAVLLAITFLVILFESFVIRILMVLLFLTALFLNLLTIAFYMLFDAQAVACMDMEEIFGSIACYWLRLPTQYHTVYCSLLLALLHFLAFIASLLLNHYYDGSIVHLVEIAKQLGYKPCYTYKKEACESRRSRRRRSEGRRFGTNVDVKQLPVGTVITTERSTSYKWKGNVQPGGVVIGSGMESMTDSVTLQAPTKEAVKRDSKFTRYVMVDAVRAKLKRGGRVVPARKRVSIDRQALEKKKSRRKTSASKELQQGELPTRPGGSTSNIANESELETITFNSLLEMDPNSPRSYISDKSQRKTKSRKRKK